MTEMAGCGPGLVGVYINSARSGESFAGPGNS